jgi:hypothetical protein
MEEQVYWYLELVLDVLSSCVYKAEVCRHLILPPTFQL